MITSRSEGWLSERLVGIELFAANLLEEELIDDVVVETFAEFARLTFALRCGEMS